MTDPHTIAVTALKRCWTHDETPGTVVDWIFAALDDAGDSTVLRTPESRDIAIAMAGMVFADLGSAGEGIDYHALVRHVIRAACGHTRQEHHDGLCLTCGESKRGSSLTSTLMGQSLRGSFVERTPHITRTVFAAPGLELPARGICAVCDWESETSMDLMAVEHACHQHEREHPRRMS